jgi:hypothetical protein
VTFWLLAAAAAQAPGRSSQPAECTLAGFVLKQRQLPRTLSSQNAAVVYTLHNKDTAQLLATPDAAATAAACNHTAACAMFTSDGFLIGAYRSASTVDAFNAAIASEQQGGGPLSWVPMHYCAGRCCGTWVATDLEQLLLTPAADTGNNTGNSSLQLGPEEEDKTPSDSGSFSFDAQVMRRFCPLTIIASLFPSASPPQQQQQQHCPRRCYVACCAKFVRGQRRFDSHNDFEQCAPYPCADGCSLPGNASAVIGKGITLPRASLAMDVLKRQYVRAVTAQNSSTPPLSNATTLPSESLNLTDDGFDGLD